ncbi:type II secretion system protein [Pseudomonas saliphila]|uniref:type II secretion system protein n=1 Tax=Pseudomonas saliphila TaxID=2586906 RepID=UPI0012386D26|nr:prepilin-type N-terminal cleavage/methylation domain-containing protein [Pseudomonas saliphila]
MYTHSINASAVKQRLRQQGVSLIEALVSVLLVGITGAGLVAVTSQVLSTQRYATTENQVLLGLREALLEDPGVTSINVAGSTIGFNREPQTLQLTVRMGSVEKTVNLETNTLVVTDDPDGLIGGDGGFQLGY